MGKARKMRFLLTTDGKTNTDKIHAYERMGKPTKTWSMPLNPSFSWVYSKNQIWISWETLSQNKKKVEPLQLNVYRLCYKEVWRKGYEESWWRKCSLILSCRNIITRFGSPLDLVSDWGDRFINKVIKELSIRGAHLKNFVIVLSCKKIITRFGSPLELVSDRGAHFINKVIKELSKFYKIPQMKETPYYPQANGQNLT